MQRLAIPAVLAVVATACGSDAGRAGAGGGDGSERRDVIVTHSILGDVVRQLVGDAAGVRVIVPDGQDPHDYEPSAKDVEAIRGAALVVENGFDLEEGLAPVLDEAADTGVPVFVATDHLTVRRLGAGEPGDEHGGDDAHAGSVGGVGGDGDGAGGDRGGPADPHFWTDPTKMSELAPALAAELERVLGVDLDARLAALQSSLTALDEEVARIMVAIPPGGCRLVTGHESLGYLAERYGCTLIGAVVPSLSSSAEASAQAIAELRDVAVDAEVVAIFTEVGTPAQITRQIADDVGVPVVELPSHDLPDEGGYGAYLTDLATRIAVALDAP